MNIEHICEKAGIETSTIDPLKLSERKSSSQPHTWMLYEESVPKYVLKFSGISSDIAKRLVVHEADFYKKLATIHSSSNITQNIPIYLDSGESEEGCYLITSYHDLPLSSRWLPRAFKNSPKKVISWQSKVLEWLLHFQKDPMIRKTFEVPKTHVIYHGDFNYFNILSDRNDFVVVDMETWGTTEFKFLDALHLMVSPTIANDDVDSQVQSFFKYWAYENFYRQQCLNALSLFLEGIELEEAMRIYLEFQIALCEKNAPSIATTFQLCLSQWINK